MNALSAVPVFVQVAYVPVYILKARALYAAKRSDQHSVEAQLLSVSLQWAMFVWSVEYAPDALSVASLMALTATAALLALIVYYRVKPGGWNA